MRAPDITDPEKVDTRKYLSHFWSFIKPYKRPLRTIYILYALNAVLNLLPALSIRYYIDLVFGGRDVTFLWIHFHSVTSASSETKVIFSIIFFAAITLLIIFANSIGVIMWRLGTRSVEQVLLDIKIHIHNHINKLSLGYFNSERVGIVMTKAVGDVGQVSNMLRQSFNLLYMGAHMFITPIIMALLSPWLTLVALLPLAVIFYSYKTIRNKLKPMYKEARENESEINSQIQEIISGLKEIKAFNMERRTEKTYGEVNLKFFNLQNRIMKVFSFNHQLQYGTRDLGTVLVAVAGGIFIITGFGNVTIGMIASFTMLCGMMYAPVSGLLSFYDTFQRGMVSLERIIDFLNADPDVKDAKHAVTLARGASKGVVRYENVSFSYDPAMPVLKDISFQTSSGEKCAIVGPTGSGKSTLLSLLMRFYDVTDGRISLDGRDIRGLTQDSLRSQIGIVFQETFLFYGTIRDNLLFVKPEANEEELIAACRAANIHDTVMAFPDGYDTRVGERGATLSGGQKQRLSIARVILKNPAIVILDEATSAVDTVTEELIQRSIGTMLLGRTSFIIAHRLSTIMNCDRVIVLSDHHIAEIGSPAELIDRKGLFHEMWNKGR